MEEKYHINIYWSDEDECWLSEIPDLEGCISHGYSEEEALQNILTARGEWIAATRDAGRPIPHPVYRPDSRRAS